MTTFDYTRTRATAERLIAKFGQSATLIKSTAGGTAYNPTLTSTSYSLTLAVMEYSQHEIDGTMIVRGDKKAYVSTSGLSVAPVVGDTLTIESVRHQAINVKPLSPAGTVVFWEVQARP